MKKLLILMLVLFLALPLMGNSRMNSEDRFMCALLEAKGYTMLPEVIVTAYRNPQDTIKKQTKQVYEEFDDLYYQPKKDGNHGKMTEAKLKKIINKQNQKDSLLFDALKKPDLTINNYYNDDPFFYSNHLSRFYHGGFNYWYYNDPFYYNPWFYDNFWFGWNYPYRYYNPYNFYFGYGWNSWNFGLNWNWYYPHYSYSHYSYFPLYNNYVHNDFRKPEIDRHRDRFPTMSNYVEKRPQIMNPRKEIIPQDRLRNNMQSKPKYSENRRTYTPSYEKPRMGVRPQFNNSRIENRGMGMQNMEQRRNTDRMIQESNTRAARSRIVEQNQRGMMNSNRETSVQSPMRSRQYEIQNNISRQSMPMNNGNMTRSYNNGNSYSGGSSVRNSGSSFSGGNSGSSSMGTSRSSGSSGSTSSGSSSSGTSGSTPTRR